MKIILNSIKWYLNFAITLTLMYPNILKLEKTREQYDPEEFDKEVYDITTKWAKKQLDCAKVNVIVTGNENLIEENVLFVSNHQGNFDIPVHMHYLNKPKGFIAKKSIEKFPIISRYMYIMNSLFIDRNNMKDAARIIVEGIKILKDGHSLIIYPEGTRSQSSKVGEFKSGAIKLATKSKVKIIPVSIDGTYKIMEANNNKIKKGTIRLHIHEPIDPNNMSKEEVDGLSDKIKKIIEDKVIELSKLN